MLELAQELFADDPRRQRILVKAYSCLVAEHDGIQELVAARTLSLCPLPCAVAVGNLSALSPLESFQLTFVLRDGQMIQLAERRSHSIPDTDVLLLMAPIVSDGLNTEYALTNASIDQMQSIIAMQYGRLPFHQPIMDFEFDRTGQISMSSNVVEMPLWSMLLSVKSPIGPAVAKALCEAPQDARVKTAVGFVAKGIRERDPMYRFSAMWMALEVLVSGSAGAIKAALQKCYGQKSHKYVDGELHFAVLAKMRHSLFHQGEFVDLAPYQERMLLAYFWDILSVRLGFNCPRFAEAILATAEAREEIAGLSSVGRL